MTCPAHDLAASRRMLVKADVDLIRDSVATLLGRSISRAAPTVGVYVVDLGAGSGTTALAVFAEAPPGDTKVVTIDNDEDALNWAQAAVENIGRRNDWTRLDADSKDPVAAAQVAEDGIGIDLLLLDCSHDYEGVKAELALWLPDVNITGIVWVHDYGDPADFGLASEATPGVKKAVDELVDAGELDQLETRGLGWAGMKSVPSTPTEEAAASEVEAAAPGEAEAPVTEEAESSSQSPSTKPQKSDERASRRGSRAASAAGRSSGSRA